MRRPAIPTSSWAFVSGCALLTPLLATGCYSPGGGLFATSNAQYVYVSTETQVMTVTMVDIRTGQPFFVQAIPPGQQLTVQFLDGGGDDAVQRPDRLIYELQPAGTSSGALLNQMTVPPAAARRIDVDVSQTPQPREVPVNERFRTDDPSTRPDYWSPQGGVRPQSTGSMYD